MLVLGLMIVGVLVWFLVFEPNHVNLNMAFPDSNQFNQYDIVCNDYYMLRCINNNCGGSLGDRFGISGIYIASFPDDTNLDKFCNRSIVARIRAKEWLGKPFCRTNSNKCIGGKRALVDILEISSE